MSQRKTLVAIAVSSTLLLATTHGARAQGYWPWGAFAAGTVTGLVVGATIARPPVYGYPAPVYGYPAPAYFAPPPYGIYGPPAAVFYPGGGPVYGPPPAAYYRPPPPVVYAPPPPAVVYRGYGGW